MNKPTFLCIGAQKAGTTWLHNCLLSQPQIWLYPYKEIHYFDTVHLKANYREKRAKNLCTRLTKVLEGVSRDSMADLKLLSELALVDQYTDSWYLSLFERAAEKKIVGEITPAYSALPEAGVKHINDLLGNIKIIFIMRNPVKRAWSAALMSKRKEIKKGQLISDADWIEYFRRQDHQLRANYKRTVENYKKYFSDILYLFYDDVCEKPISVLEEVCYFLNVPPDLEAFGKICQKRFNANPKVKIPELVETYLKQELSGLEEWVVEQFNPRRLEL